MRLKSERGSVLIFSYAVIMTLTLLGAGLMTRNVSESIMSRRFDYSTRAFWLAEAGLRQAIHEFNNGDGNWTGWTGTNPRTFQGTLNGFGDFDVSIANPTGGAPEITATGSYPARGDAGKVQRVVSSVLTRSGTLFTYAAFGKSSVSLSGQGKTDSYDSSLGNYNVSGNKSANGDVGTNGDISGSGQADIDGDAGTGPEGVFNDSSMVSGAITHETNVPLSPVTVPDSLASMAGDGTINESRTIPPGQHRYTAIDLSGKDVVTINGPADIYLTGLTSFRLSGQSYVRVNGAVTFYVDGAMTISGQGIANTSLLPSNLIIYGTETCTDIHLTGQANFYGAVYAPSADLDCSGQGALLGSFIGKTATISGQGGIHYDEDLSDLTTTMGTYAVRSWKENQNPRPIS